MLDSLFAFLLPAPSLPDIQPFELNMKEPTALFEVQTSPELVSDHFAPFIGAKAALVMDLNSGLVLYEKNTHEPLPMASLTKIMVAIIILEHHELDEVVTVPSAYPNLEGVRMWLLQGEKITVEDLLKGLLIPSGGDAAMALGAYHSGSVEAFVEEMNARALVLGLKDMHFENPVGLDAPDQYATAYELALLTQHALRFPAFGRIVNTSATIVTSTDGAISHELKSTNKLFGSYLDIRGVKTGTTDNAGQSLITLTQDEKGHEILTVLLNSPDRFQEAKAMTDWAMRSFEWK